MKIVQTYWSLPAFKNEKSDQYGKFSGGFFNEKYHAFSWALSVLKLKEFYENIELVTDRAGKEWLIDHLKLPYTKVTVCLNQFDNYNPLLWALPKLHAYSLQREPFLHVDGDIFIWEKFDKEFSEARLVVQNIEVNNTYYRDILTTIGKNFNHIPELLQQDVSGDKEIISVNAGVIGGRDYEFFGRYSREAFDFVEKNQADLHRINLGRLNVIFEQLLFYRLAEKEGVEIKPLFQQDNTDFYFCTGFDKVPYIQKYIHLLSVFKKSETMAQQMAHRFEYEYPEQYNFINKLYSGSDSVHYYNNIADTIPTNTLPPKKENWNDFFKNTFFILNYLDEDIPTGDYSLFSNTVHELITSDRKDFFHLKVLSDIFIIENSSYELSLYFINEDEMHKHVYECRVKFFDATSKMDADHVFRIPLSLNKKLIRMASLNFSYPVEITKAFLTSLLSSEPDTVDYESNGLAIIYNKGFRYGIGVKFATGQSNYFNYFDDNGLTGHQLFSFLGVDVSSLDFSTSKSNILYFLSQNILYNCFLTFDENAIEENNLIKT